jgi:enoyl-CoA hydratase/carnithine racemase
VSVRTAGKMSEQPDDHRITTIEAASPDDCRVSADDIETLTLQIRAAAARETRVVVLTSGTADFCHGKRSTADKTAEYDHDQRLLVVSKISDFRAAVRTSPMPVLAAVRGQARGLGWAIAASCDLVIASETARFSLPELRDGFAPLIALSAVLDSVRQSALYAVLSGEAFEASANLGSRPAAVTYADNELDRRVREFAESIADRSPVAVQAILKFLRAAADASARDTLAVGMFADFIRRRAQSQNI